MMRLEINEKSSLLIEVDVKELKERGREDNKKE